MHNQLIEYSSTLKVPTGRRIFIMLAALKVADAYGDAHIVDKCDAAVTTDRHTLEVELAYREQKNSVTGARGNAAEVDAQIDDRMGRMYRVADSQAVGDDQVAEMAADFRRLVYPDGLAGLVNLDYESQLAIMENLLERFDGDLADHVDILGLRRHTDVLGTLVPSYRDELEKENKQQVTYADVKAARVEGFDKFAAAVFAILSTYDDSSDPQHVERREAILAEYHRQNEIVSASFRRKKKVDDIDPDTGEPVGDDAADEDVVEPVA